MKQAVPWYFPSKIIWLYVPNWRCTSRILIWGNDIRISCFPLVPLGFFTNMNLFNKESVIFLAVRNASATFRYISHYRWNRPCHGDFSSLMWLSTTWCDLSISPLWHGDDVTFPAWCDLSTVLVWVFPKMRTFGGLCAGNPWNTSLLSQNGPGPKGRPVAEQAPSLMFEAVTEFIHLLTTVNQSDFELIPNCSGQGHPYILFVSFATWRRPNVDTSIGVAIFRALF